MNAGCVGPLTLCRSTCTALRLQSTGAAIKAASGEPLIADALSVLPTNIAEINLRGTLDFPVEKVALRILPSSVNIKDLSRQRAA
jgi:hypothetical protein